METRPRNLDVSQLGARILAEAIGDVPKSSPPQAKSAAAVERGRLGGNKGGQARSAKLTAEQRSEIARQAAAKRWGRQQNP